jgi:signal transduction histidine kinase
MVPLLGIDGELESILSVSIDVTDTINYQKQIEQQNQDLSDFSFMVSHDLKAPIFTIQGMADALIEDHSSSLDQEAKTLINFILNASHRLDRLVASVLEYSSLSSGGDAIEEVSLDEILEQVMNDLSGQIQAKNAIIKAKSELPYIKGESIRVYQVLSNLIGNAIKYSDKSRIPEIEISATSCPPSMIALKIKDNGLGIPENKLEEIFRPYRRAHGGDIEGSGIGLACVKKIVDRLGGQVLVESKEGVGSEFTVILPSAKHLRKPIPEDLKRLF